MGGRILNVKTAASAALYETKFLGELPEWEWHWLKRAASLKIMPLSCVALSNNWSTWKYKFLAPLPQLGEILQGLLSFKPRNSANSLRLHYSSVSPFAQSYFFPFLSLPSSRCWSQGHVLINLSANLKQEMI